jgi:hypothetical protein
MEPANPSARQRLARRRLLRRLAVGWTLALAAPTGCGGDVEEPSEAQAEASGGTSSGGDSNAPIWSCLSEGTRVTTPSGARPIEELRPGDVVVSFDHDTGELRHNPITAIRRARRTVGEVRVPGGRLLATEEHPFYDAVTRDYVPSSELDWSAALVTLAHADVPDSLRSVTELGATVAAPYLPNVGEANVYDLTVARDHNYFAEGVLVHNKSGGSPVGWCDTYRMARAQVCSGPATVEFQDDRWVVRRTSEPSMGGAANLGGAAGFGGVSTRSDPIVVAFEVCSDFGQALPHAYVAPEQTVLMGDAPAGLCTEPYLTTVTAADDGWLPTWVGYVHVEIEPEEFSCLYLGAPPDPALCEE